MNEPIRQHWVPKVYLRQFATADTLGDLDPQVNVLDIPSNKQFTSSINNITKKKHLYTIGVNEEEKCYAVEKWLSLIETKVKPYLLRLANGENVQSIQSAKYILSIFIATLISRNPRMLNLLHQLRKEDHPITQGYPEEAKKWLIDQDNEGMQIFFSRSILWSAKPLAKDILNMKWCLIHAASGEFVTTDNPVCIYNANESPCGISTLGTNIHLAISPKYMLLIGNDLPVDENKTYSMPEEGISGFNSVIIWRAERYLISANTFDSIQNLICESIK